MKSSFYIASLIQEAGLQTRGDFEHDYFKSSSLHQPGGLSSTANRAVRYSYVMSQAVLTMPHFCAPPAFFS